MEFLPKNFLFFQKQIAVFVIENCDLFGDLLFHQSVLLTSLYKVLKIIINFEKLQNLRSQLVTITS